MGICVRRPAPAGATAPRRIEHERDRSTVRSVVILRRAPVDTSSGDRAAPRGPRRPAIIALVGIDGSGKTTQAQRLAHALTAAGSPATYWQNAGGRRWLGRAARRLGRGDAQRLLGRRGLLVVESVLRWLAIARALLRSRLRGTVAVMDRYAACQYASIRAHGRPGTVRQGRGERLARVIYRPFPRPDITFLLAVEPGEAYRRIEARGTDHESIDYLAAAQNAYQALPERADFVVIDAGGSLDEVTRAVFARVPELAGTGGAGDAAGDAAVPGAAVPGAAVPGAAVPAPRCPAGTAQARP